MSYLQKPKALIDSDVGMTLSYPAHKILWLAERKHMAFWTATKPMVIFGLSYDEIIKTCRVGRKAVAPALRELQDAGLLTLIRKGFKGDKERGGQVSQFRLSSLDKDRQFGTKRAVPKREREQCPNGNSNARSSAQTGTITTGEEQCPNGHYSVSTAITPAQVPESADSPRGDRCRPVSLRPRRRRLTMVK